MTCTFECEPIAPAAPSAISEAEAAGFLQQITTDFEELTWLRGLATHIELCDVHNSVYDVATAVLPSLRELIAAETLVLLPLVPAGHCDNSAENYVVGEAAPSAASWSAIIQQFGAAALTQPIVRNLHFGEGVGDDVQGVRSIVLAHVGRGTHQYGWLLALNKQQQPPGSTSAHSLTEGEFGTFEAGLVSAAAVMLGSQAHNLAMFQEQETLLRGLVKALINSIDAKDPYTCGHSDRVAQMACRLGQQLGQSARECERIYMTGLLHDIGKIGVPDEVLLKPGKLTDEEFALIKKHPEIGHGIVQHLAQLSYALPGILHHHESYDGRGYPQGLAGENIPFLGRLLAVVDAYDAMTSNRPYRAGMPTAKAEAILREKAGQQWDPQMVDAFFAALPAMYAICGFTADESASAPRRIAAGLDQPLALATTSAPPISLGVISAHETPAQKDAVSS